MPVADCGVADEHGPIEAFGFRDELDDCWIEMNAVGDDVGADAIIGEDRAQNTRTAMIERTHGIESMRGVAGSGGDSSFSSRKIGVGMPEADADTAPRGFGNNFGRAL